MKGRVLASFNGVEVLFDVKYGLDGELRLSFSEVPFCGAKEEASNGIWQSYGRYR